MKSSKSRHGPNSLKRITVACNTGDSLSLAACVHAARSLWPHFLAAHRQRIRNAYSGSSHDGDLPATRRSGYPKVPYLLRAQEGDRLDFGDIALRYCFRFHHSHPRTGLKSGKILGCGLCIRFRNRFCNSTHPGVVACPGFEVGHLPFQVLSAYPRGPPTNLTDRTHAP